jgi:aspartyl-tRNA(Asn)/glutamyl-tRNA(Gln) amidotransferase subunit A
VAHPYQLSLTQAAAAIRDHQLSPVELTESLLGRVDVLEPKLIAWATLTPDLALDSAREAERAIAATGMRSPIHGVPFGAKDIFDTAGVRTAAGSKIWASRVPDTDATSIAIAKQAGGVLLGKTHTTEFADGDPAPSRNPWDSEHTPGGSSTGSGVAVAARMVPWAFGSQTGGSVLRPAAYNGVVGLKPTFGRISKFGVIPMAASLDHVGVLTRSVEDAAILLSVLAGHDPNDPDSADVPVGDYLSRLDSATPPRIGFVRGWFLDESDAETRLKTEEVALTLARAGAQVEEVDPGIDFAEAVALHRVVLESEIAAWHEPMFRGNEELYGPSITAYIERGFTHSATRYFAAWTFRREMQRLAARALERVDVLLMPTVSAPAPRDLTQTGDPRFQGVWSLTGFPAISLPVGLASHGLPLAVQMVCGPFREATLLAAARWAERTLGVDLDPIT